MALKPLQDLGIKLVAAVVPFITDFAKEEVDYLVRYEKKVVELGEVVDKLRVQRKKVDDKVAEEEGRYGREIYDDVIVWLGHVDTVLSEYDKFKEEEDREHARCCLGYPLNSTIGCGFCKRIKEIRKQVEQLLLEKHEIISRWKGAPSMGVAFSNADYQSFVSRTEAMDKIMKALQNPRTRMIGVHGLAGVGKTTLVIEAAKNAQKEKLFNVVIMANVTKSPDIRKIQGQIADMLGMKLEDESEHARAVRIQEKLKGEDSTLIILDDLWAKVDLHMLGIPSMIRDVGIGSEKNLILNEGKSAAPVAVNTMETEQTLGLDAIKTDKTSAALPSSKLKEKTEERYKYKVLLISEVRQVLVKQMDGKESSIFPVNVLSGKDAETLFKKTAGIGDKNSELGKLAAQIAKKCNGLPMSIVTTARALRNQSHSVWEDTHRKLERKNLTGTPEYSTKLSYQLLENEELKTTFLLCARMGHDALVMDLVKHCIGLGFLQGIYTVREARDRVQTLLAKLKQSGLLSDSYSSDRFTMQNLVRDAALSIASKESHVFTLTEVKLDEWPDEDKLKRYTAIFLHHCDIIEEFPKSIRCPRLRVFHIDNHDSRLKIPDNFFQQTKELRVLILTGIHLSPLPPSIRCLTKLRMLCLEQCTLGEQLSLIGELTNLRILSFSGSDIESLPIELKQLSKLQIFDISNCSKLRVIPPNVISSLTSLEELYMRNVSIQWRVHERRENQSENVSLSELGYLNQLTNLDIQIPSVAHLPQNLFFDNLNNYKIVIGSSNRYFELDFEMPEKYELSRSLAIQQKDGFGIHSQKGIKMLFERVEHLLLENLNGVEDIFYELNFKGFPCLQHLSIVSNYGIKSLIKPKERKHPEKAFPKLESLHLYKLKNMEQICSSSCQLSESSFGKLKIIKIKLCAQLKNVFLISTVRRLIALETIQVSECNSLKEIVPEETQENADEDELKFPELRSLTLQSLPKFIGFYPISSSGETDILFHKKVVVSKLERMELSSIQINQIWIDQCSHFQNLIHLDVNGCWKLEYLLSFSMAKNLVKLQSLFVSECVKMERIFSQGQDTDAKMKLDGIFPNLKNIKLSNMKSLSEIWSSKVPVDSFGKLDTLIIEKCDKFVNVFPRYMVKIFQSLGSLRVTNCKSMNAIFDLPDQKQDARVITKLQDVHLETLPQLEHVLKWKKDQEGILELTNLQKLWVQDCDNLENIFPVSVAKTLENLEYLMVWDCFFMREIVAKGDADNNPTSSISFEFPRLTTIKFLKLPKLNSFYPGAYELSCPELNDLSVELCDKLDPFREETADAQRKPVLFPEKVINKLKSMQIESWHVNSSTNYDYRRDNLEDLCLSKLNDTNILYSFLHHNPSLKSLWLNNCSFEELVPLKRPPKIESLGVVPKLKDLKLTELPNLKNICFERDIILQRIEFLSLKNCPSLDTIVLSSISLSHLTNLELADCKGLKYLMHPLTAKSLGKLRNMKVINCESLEEIVLEQRIEEAAGEVEGGGEGQNAGKVDVIFGKLKALELVSLKNLKSFCSSKSCVFEFPSLEKVVVSACPKMENFSQNFPQEVKSTPILQKVYVVQENEKRWCWEGNLQATIQYMFKNKKFFEGMAILDVSEHLDLEQIWQGKGGLRKDFSYSLKTLKLDNCKFESYAIRPSVLRCLKSLKELEVRNCDNITGIFEMDGTKRWGTSFSMKKLTLEELPGVTHVWGHDKQGIPSFHNLQQVTVTNCKKVKMLFPVALARNLKMLEKLEVKRCDELLEIVGKEGEAAEGTEEKFVFPLLTKLALHTLPKLTHFYSERFTLECPELNVLQVTGCNNFELFQSQQEACPKSQGSTSIIRQPLFSDIKGVSKVEELYLSWKGISWLGQPTDQGLQHLHELILYGSGSSTLPIEILEKTPNLERMDIFDCESLKELFPSPNPQNGTEMLGNLQKLFLVRLSKLQSMEGLEYLSKLRLLYVKGCPGLTTLAQSCSNVKYLRIGDCEGLECLFTSSAAKMSIHLVDMDIWGCESMKEIVGKEHDDETETEEIKFEWLERIKLQSLSKLECFYSGNNTLHLPSLIRVDIVKCPKLKIFSQGLIHAESSRGVLFSYAPNDDLVFHQDLNSAVGQWILHETHLVLADYPEVEGLWTGRVPIPSDMSFNKLRTLKVEGCEFLSNVVLPSHVLPLLRNLEELVVRKCNSIKGIFDVENTPTRDDDSDMIVIPLKKLILQQLPTLRHVWNEDPKGRLSFPLLKEVLVKECESIKSLFPISVAKDNLQKLDVINCVELVEIVANDEGAKEEAIVEVTMFPSLTWLQLWSLPNLRCICSGMQILNWPMLRNLVVSYCRNLKLFATNFQNSPVSHPKGQDRFTTNNQRFVLGGKVVAPNLEKLSLNKEDVIMIEQERLHVDLPKTKNLIFHSFNDESDAFPHVFFLEVPLPSIQGLEVTDSAFEEIFPSQGSDLDYYEVLSKLKRLELHVLPKLKSLGLERTWMAPLLENLEYLRVWGCRCLTNLAPSTVSLSHLTRLQVEHCVGLEYLFTSSTTRSFVVLREMSISNCESLEKVVADDGDQPNEDLIFTELTTLSLSQLPKLESFYKGNSTLNFPCLKDVSFTQCTGMKTFSHGNVAAPTISMVEINGIRCYGSGLNTAFSDDSYTSLVLGEYPELSEPWLGKVSIPDNCSFSKLRSLVVEECQFLTNAVIPSHLLCFLSNLEELVVRKCDSVKAIFEVKDTPTHDDDSDMIVIPLKKLTMEQLPTLRHVWNEDPKGRFSFPLLKEVFVKECKSIKSLFPTSVAKEKLQKLDVINCVKLEEIVAKDEGATEGAIKEVNMFPSLTWLKLWSLPNLRCICSGKQTLNWPVLRNLVVSYCRNLKIFATDFQNCPDSHTERQDCCTTDNQGFISTRKVVSPYLEQLSLNKEDVVMIEQERLHVDLQKIKTLILHSFNDESDAFPHVFFLEVPLPSIQGLEVTDSAFEEIFPSQRPDLDYYKILSKLKRLELHVLPNLKSIGLERTWMAPLLENLEYLRVWSCRCLTNLAPSTVSLSRLTRLQVEHCVGLEYLFTSSTTKSFVVLREMSISKCESLERVVAEEGDQPDEDVIFTKLSTLSLSQLPKLESFYSGKSTLNFPCLKDVSFTQLKSMKTFSHGNLAAPGISMVEINGIRCYGIGLNTAFSDDSYTSLVLGDYPELNKPWLGQVPIPDNWSFSKLRSLVVEGCQFLTNAIIPSHLLCFLSNLEELVVRKCDSVKAIFEVKDTPARDDDSDMIVIPLKKLILQQLPILRHVWNEDPKGRLSFPLLREVLVKECKSIKSLFPTSVAKDNLKKLDVINCVELVEIVANDEGAKEEEAIVEVTMFPSLTWLQLWSLPNLRCICSGMQIVNWPSLRNLVVSYCRNLKIFATDFQNSPDSHPGGQDRFTLDNQGFISARKVFAPYLEQLSLNKEDAVMIEQRRLHVDLQKVKTLILHSFNDESDTFPHVFFMEMPLPSIQGLEVTDSVFEEIFPSQRPDLDHYEILSKLKRLELHVLPKLKSIGLEHTWMAPLLENLEYLKVWSCKCLTNLAPSTVSLSHLTRLHVAHCVGLEYLFTSSTAKSLVVLREMSISKCELLEKVVAEEGDQPDEDVIFSELTILSLSQLPKLESFYTGNSTMDFPCLKDISLTQCKSMKTFCHGNVVAPYVSEVEIDGIRCNGDLNIAVCQQFDKGNSLELA